MLLILAYLFVSLNFNFNIMNFQDGYAVMHLACITNNRSILIDISASSLFALLFNIRENRSEKFLLLYPK